MKQKIRYSTPSVFRGALALEYLKKYPDLKQSHKSRLPMQNNISIDQLLWVSFKFVKFIATKKSDILHRRSFAV